VAAVAEEATIRDSALAMEVLVVVEEALQTQDQPESEALEAKTSAKMEGLMEFHRVRQKQPMVEQTLAVALAAVLGQEA
jgi:polyhydroxyalkanoate synthesis regulator phasin